METSELNSESEKKIIESYNKFLSVRGVSKDTGYSWNRIVKALSNNGYVLSETHAEILEKYGNGMDIETIACGIKMNKKTVQAYIQRKRPVYNENQSDNAMRIKKCRSKKERYEVIK